MNPAGDQTVAFKTAQGLGQHLLRDPADPALQFAVSHRSLGERADHERGPPVGDPVEHLPRGTTGIDDVAISHIDARDIARCYRNGGAEEVTPGVKDVTGQAAATFEEFVKQHTSGF